MPDLTSFPDLQIEASNPLGNGSPAVCDRTGCRKPAAFQESTRSPSIRRKPNIITVNDLACRFLDGSGSPIGRPSDLRLR